MNNSENVTGLRIVTFNVLPLAYGAVARWAEENGHTLALVVTTPGPSTRRMPMYTRVVGMAPPTVDVLVTTRLRRVALPLIRELRPDLIVSFTFPYRIPYPARTDGNPSLRRCESAPDRAAIVSRAKRGPPDL
jgi:hypothetical protein